KDSDAGQRRASNRLVQEKGSLLRALNQLTEPTELEVHHLAVSFGTILYPKQARGPEAEGAISRQLREIQPTRPYEREATPRLVGQYIYGQPQRRASES
ncbi:MAG TPA: hypothetical protein VIK24_12890, partial [Pyrinomonadaceae bacterium]